MKTNLKGKELEGIIREFETGNESRMTIVANGSYGVNDNSNRIYQTLRYYIKKLGSEVKVTREYNMIYLVK